MKDFFGIPVHTSPFVPEGQIYLINDNGYNEILTGKNVELKFKEEQVEGGTKIWVSTDGGANYFHLRTIPSEVKVDIKPKSIFFSDGDLSTSTDGKNWTHLGQVKSAEMGLKPQDMIPYNPPTVTNTTNTGSQHKTKYQQDNILMMYANGIISLHEARIQMLNLTGKEQTDNEKKTEIDDILDNKRGLNLGSNT